MGKAGYRHPDIPGIVMGGQASTGAVECLVYPPDQFIVHLIIAGDIDLVIAHPTRRLLDQPIGWLDTFHVQTDLDAGFAGRSYHGKLTLAPQAQVRLLGRDFEFAECAHGCHDPVMN